MRALLVAALIAMLAGCGSQPPAPTHYLLRPDSPGASGELAPSSRYRLGELVVADYADQPGLVLETAQGQVHSARGHLWAEPIGDGLRAFLGAEISAAIGRDVLFAPRGGGRSAIDIRVDQLHGTEAGEAVLVAYWQLVPEQGEPRAYRFAQRRELAAEGYAALVEAQKALLRELAVEIAAVLESRDGQG